MKPFKTALAGLFTLLAAGSANAQNAKYDVITEYLWACTDDQSAQTVAKVELAVSRQISPETRQTIVDTFTSFALEQLSGVNTAFYEQIDKRGLLPRTHAELAATMYFSENKPETFRLRMQYMADFGAAFHPPVLMSGCGLNMKEKAFVYMFAEKIYKDSMTGNGYALSPVINAVPTVAMDWPIRFNRLQ